MKGTPAQNYRRSRKKLQPTTMLANFTYVANHAHGALELGVILASVESTLLVRSTGINGRVTGSANVELCELVELDFDGICWVALALSLCLLGLFDVVSKVI